MPPLPGLKTLKLTKISMTLLLDEVIITYQLDAFLRTQSCILKPPLSQYYNTKAISEKKLFIILKQFYVYDSFFAILKQFIFV